MNWLVRKGSETVLTKKTGVAGSAKTEFGVWSRTAGTGKQELLDKKRKSLKG